MTDGITLELIELFVLYIVVIMIWMWNTKKLFARDYATAVCASFITPFALGLAYYQIPSAWHNLSNDLLIMIMMFFILHMVCNTIRRIARSM